MAITDLSARLKKNLDEGYFTCCVFLDLLKAFDTVNHTLLLKKLQFNRIRGNMFNLLNNYLSKCSQFIQCDETQSHINKIVYGVPHDSTLGPLLFSLYVNDLPLHTKCHVNLFADDTVRILKGKNVDELQQILDEELSVVDGWMKFNRLSINCLKTTYTIIAPKSKKSCTNKLKAVNHPANSGGLQQLKLNYNFSYFLFRFWGCGCKDIQQIQKDIPRQKLFRWVLFFPPKPQ